MKIPAILKKSVLRRPLQFYAISGYYSTPNSEIGRTGTLSAIVKAAYNFCAANWTWLVALGIVLIFTFLIYKKRNVRHSIQDKPIIV